VRGGRRTVVVRTVIVGVLVLAAAAAWRLRPATRPNVLLITLDTTRADHIGCYGHKEARTTAIDSLAAGGVTFDNAYVTVPMTLPSHASMLTGLYPAENGLPDNGAGRLADTVPTLAELLQQHSYNTGAFIGSIVLHARSGLDRGFDLYDDDMVGGEQHGDESHLMRNARLVVDSALNWLNSQDDDPFFCWLHFFDPHAPYQGHAEIFGDRFASNPYDGDIAFADVHIDRLLQRLKETGKYDNTLIIVVGDHGEGFGDHDELEHGFLLYNPTVRVPLIVVDPRTTAAGTRVAAPVSLVDLMPTVLDCLEIPSVAHASGQSLQPALQRQPLESHPCYSQTTSAFSAFGWAPLKSITTDAWKYIQTTHDELYDLRQDPGELHNLAATNAEQAQQMQQLLADVEAQMAVVEVAENELSEADRRALLALGYVGGSGNTAPATPGEPRPDVKDMIRFYNADMAARKQMSSGQLEAAIAALQQTIEEAPGFVRARLTLGAAYQMQDRLDDAAAVYEEALRLAPDSHEANFDFATLQAGRGETESAIEHYRAAIEARPSAATAHINLATLLYSSGDIDGARQSFEAALQAFPDSTAGQFNYGVFLAEQGELDAGVQHVERAAALNPRNPQIQFRLGELLVQQGRFGAAAERFAETLRLNPRYPQAAEQLAEAERRAGNL
jgi:arylsulfatase A-like enzyme/Tfp pilus assembly protein PilF